MPLCGQVPHWGLTSAVLRPSVQEREAEEQMGVSGEMRLGNNPAKRSLSGSYSLPLKMKRLESGAQGSVQLKKASAGPSG